MYNIPEEKLLRKNQVPRVRGWEKSNSIQDEGRNQLN